MQFRTRLKTWYSYGTWRIPLWLIQRSNYRSSTYRTTTRPTARSNIRPETSRAYRLSSIYAGDWVITCSTRISRPPLSSSCPGSPFGSSRKLFRHVSPWAWRHYWPLVRPLLYPLLAHYLFMIFAIMGTILCRDIITMAQISTNLLL